MGIVKYAGEIAAGLVLLAMVLIGVLTVTHGTPVRSVIAPGNEHRPPGVGDSLFAESMELFTSTHFSQGNAVLLCLNGDGTYPQLWRDLAAAKHTITLQMYYSEPGQVTDHMRDILVERARAGVHVLVLLDAFGSGPLRKTDFVDAVRAAGGRVAWLRTINWYTLNRAATRSHVRVVVVDGHIAYTGGFGLADYWLGDGHHDRQWRESNVRFMGPAVAGLQAAFASGWAEATGMLLTGDMYFPPEIFQPAGKTIAGLMHTVSAVGSTQAERFLALSITGARKTLYITNSYFVPDAEFRDMLIEAVKRGVDVKVITAGDKSDVMTTVFAGRAYYDQLLRGGVRIYEYLPTMIHSKTIVADGMWASVGSMNFDNRSMAFNNEANLDILDSQFGAQMDSVFHDDLTYSKEILLPEWEKRSLYERVVEWGAEKLWRVL
ncbi:MAG: phospholipase D-like domain-containing protein [Gemmatimonadota bacterium]|nr:phospholipase D-like domain-containing protein [Gemmatimonadota bacterium]